MMAETLDEISVDTATDKELTLVEARVLRDVTVELVVDTADDKEISPAILRLVSFETPVEIELIARATAEDMEFTTPERLVKFWVVVEMAVDNDKSRVLARVLREVTVELVVEIAVDKEVTLVVVNELNVERDVVNDVIADPVANERVATLLAIEFSAKVARAISADKAEDNDTLFVLVDVDKAVNVVVNEVSTRDRLTISVERAVDKDAKL